MPARRVPENTADYARWLADRIEARWAGITLSAETAIFVAMALKAYSTLLDQRDAGELHFVVSAETDDRPVVIAATSKIDVAWAAFQAAIPGQPGARVLLRKGAQIIGEHPSPGRLAAPEAAE